MKNKVKRDRFGWKLVDAWLSRKYVVFEGDDLED